jgi:hypothetical protein
MVCLLETMPRIQVDSRLLSQEEQIARSKAQPGSYLMYKLIHLVVPLDELVTYNGQGLRHSCSATKVIPQSVITACVGKYTLIFHGLSIARSCDTHVFFFATGTNLYSGDNEICQRGVQ